MKHLQFLLLMFIVMVLSVISVKSQNPDPDTLSTNKEIPNSIFEESDICAWIPKIFTPNRDGMMDEWCIRTTGATNGHLLLRRPHQSIIKDEDFLIENNTLKCLWDNGVGSGGIQYEPGTYYYWITLTNQNTSQQRIFTGTINLGF